MLDDDDRDAWAEPLSRIMREIKTRPLHGRGYRTIFSEYRRNCNLAGDAAAFNPIDIPHPQHLFSRPVCEGEITG